MEDKPPQGSPWVVYSVMIGCMAFTAVAWAVAAKEFAKEIKGQGR